MTLGALRGGDLSTPTSAPAGTGVLFSPLTLGLDTIFVAASATAGRAGDLAVLVSTELESQWRSDAAEQYAASGERWVDLVLDSERGVRLGPLSRAEWPVCSRCADARIQAARRVTPVACAPGILSGLAAVAAGLLTREIGALAADVTGAGLLAEHLLSLDPRATTLTRHRVVGMSGCRTCAGPSRRANRAITADDLGELLTQLDGWLDPLTGVIASIQLDHPLGEDEALPTIATAAAPRLPSGTATRELPIGWGKGIGVAAAVRSAVGEAVERYSASLPDAARITWSRVGSLAGDVLSPCACGLYADEQYDRPGFPFARFDPQAVHPWVSGHWYGTDRTVWVPAVLTYLHLQLYPHQIVVQGSSNGLAAGSSVSDAADRAVLELIERDTLLTAWRVGRRFMPIDVRTVADAFQPTLAGLRRLGVNVELAWAPGATGVPTVVAIARGDGVDTPGACLGMAAAPELSGAVGSAILELAQTVPYLGGLMTSGQVPIPRHEAEVKDMADHAAYFFPTERAHWFDRLYRLESRPLDLTQSPDDNDDDLADRLLASGIRVAIVDVTAPDVASGPFRVVRAVSPDLTPITFGHGMDRVVPERVRKLPILRPAAPTHPVW